MECLICYKISLENFEKNENLTQLVCNLLDIDSSSSLQFQFVDNFTFCFECYKKLCHAQRVLKEIQDLQLIVAQIKEEIKKDLNSSQQLSEQNGQLSQDRTKIVQEINSRSELATGDDDGIEFIVPQIISVSNGQTCIKLEKRFSELEAESLPASPPELEFFDDQFDDAEHHENQAQAIGPIDHDEIDENTLKDMFTKATQLSQETRVVLEPLSLPIPSPSNNIYNINEEPIASFIKREQIHLLLKSSFKPPVVCGSNKRKKKGNNSKKKFSKNAATGTEIKPTESKPAICTICSKDCKNNYRLTIHMRVHTGELPFKCSETGCDKAFRSKQTLICHLRTHSIGDKFADCPVCHKKLYVHYMKKHIRTAHSDIKPHKCEVEDCNKAFKNVEDLNDHRISHSNTRFECTYEQCDKVFKSVRSRRNHINEIHQGLKKSTGPGGEIKAKKRYFKSRNYLCSMCPRSFYTTRTLEIHIGVVHTQEIKLQCNICNKEFKEEWCLKRHQLLHTDDRNHICYICGEAFHIKNTLTKHLSSHERQQKLVLKRVIPLIGNPNAKIVAHCSICNKGFINNRDRIRHEKVHTGECDHPCNYCEKKYYDRNTLKRHMKQKHPDKIQNSETEASNQM